jgi:hypothetical protein
VRAPLDDGAVPDLVAALGIPGLVDVHVHFMPHNVLDKVWAYFDAGGALLGRSWPITYRYDEDERIDRLRSLGLRAWTALCYPHKPGMAEWLNGWSLEFAARVPECVPTATFFPEPSAQRYVADALSAGARVFKAHVQVGRYDPRDPLLRPVWGLLADAQVPVVAHVGSGPAPGEFTGPGPFGAVLADFPRLVAVVAHMGMPEYAEFLDLAAAYDGVHLDTTMTFTDFTEAGSPYPRSLLSRLVDLQSRVVLGSDFPNIPHPYAHQLESLVRLDLGDDWLRAVCHDNGARLLGIPAP